MKIACKIIPDSKGGRTPGTPVLGPAPVLHKGVTPILTLYVLIMNIVATSFVLIIANYHEFHLKALQKLKGVMRDVGKLMM